MFEQVDDNFLAFTQNDSVEGCLFEGQLGKPGNVLATHDDHGIRESFPDLLHEGNEKRPLVGEHAADSDNLGVGRDPLDDLVPTGAYARWGKRVASLVLLVLVVNVWRIAGELARLRPEREFVDSYVVRGLTRLELCAA